MTTRRRFLQHSSLISLSPMLPSLFGTTARAANAAPDERVLVVIQLDGGNDGLNTVVPFGDDGYGRARNKLRLKTDKLHKIDDHVGLHPSMRGAKELLDDGRLAIVQGVGYPNPDRSHFRSMKIWQTARFDEADHDSYGWLGRSLDQQPLKQSGGVSDAVFVGETETPVALWSRRSSTMSLTTTEDLELNRAVNPTEPTALAAGLVQSGLVQTDLAQFISKQMLTAYDASAQLKSSRTSVNKNQETYPNTQLGSRLKTVSQLLKSGCRSRVYYTLQPGYDTHAAQLLHMLDCCESSPTQ